jgi:hypothetical protein
MVESSRSLEYHLDIVVENRIWILSPLGQVYLVYCFYKNMLLYFFKGLVVMMIWKCDLMINFSGCDGIVMCPFFFFCPGFK